MCMFPIWAGPQVEAIVGRDADARDMHLDHDRRRVLRASKRENEF